MYVAAQFVILKVARATVGLIESITTVRVEVTLILNSIALWSSALFLSQGRVADRLGCKRRRVMLGGGGGGGGGHVE